jgi:L-ascorbate metabolism protein UlaG (beta-lactamase superfamily)
MRRPRRRASHRLRAAPLLVLLLQARTAAGADGGSGQVRIEKHPGDFACFEIRTLEGLTIVSDPYALERTVAPDIVTESHQHGDHTDTSRLAGDYLLVTQPGERSLPGVKITGIAGKHGKGDHSVTNVIFVFDLQGIRIAHFASQGVPPDEEAYAKLGRVDVLMIQGSLRDTHLSEKLTGDECCRIVERLRPAIVIPAHGSPGMAEHLARCFGKEVERVPSGVIWVQQEDLRAAALGPRILYMDRVRLRR